MEERTVEDNYKLAWVETMTTAEQNFISHHLNSSQRNIQNRHRQYSLTICFDSPLRKDLTLSCRRHSSSAPRVSSHGFRASSGGPNTPAATTSSSPPRPPVTRQHIRATVATYTVSRTGYRRRRPADWSRTVYPDTSGRTCSHLSSIPTSYSRTRRLRSRWLGWRQQGPQTHLSQIETGIA